MRSWWKGILEACLWRKAADPAPGAVNDAISGAGYGRWVKPRISTGTYALNQQQDLSRTRPPGPQVTVGVCAAAQVARVMSREAAGKKVEMIVGVREWSRHFRWSW